MKGDISGVYEYIDMDQVNNDGSIQPGYENETRNVTQYQYPKSACPVHEGIDEKNSYIYVDTDQENKIDSKPADKEGNVTKHLASNCKSDIEVVHNNCQRAVYEVSLLAVKPIGEQ